jgi:hypothetical protein
MHEWSISIFVSTSFIGWLKKKNSDSFSVICETWLLILLPRCHCHQRSNILCLNSDYVQLEGECWNSKCMPAAEACHWLVSFGLNCPVACMILLSALVSYFHYYTYWSFCLLGPVPY